MGGRTSGNRTDRRGSRYIQRPVLSRDTAQELKILMLAAGQPYTPESVSAWLAAQIHARWLAYDAAIGEGAVAWEGQPL